MSITTRFQDAWLNRYIIPVVAALFALPFLDNIGRRMFLQAENSGQVYQAMEGLYMQLFHVGVVILGFVLIPAALIYYATNRLRDAAAWVAVSWLTIYGGLWDIMYYMLQGRFPPRTLTHLADTPAGLTAQLLGMPVYRELVLLNGVLFTVIGVFLAGEIRRGSLRPFFDSMDEMAPEF